MVCHGFHIPRNSAEPGWNLDGIDVQGVIAMGHGVPVARPASRLRKSWGRGRAA